MSDSTPGASSTLERQPDFTANDPYHILGVAPTATKSEIKQAYFALIRQYPPETEAETFKIVRGAYEKVKDVKRRGETDMFLPQAPPAWTPPSGKSSPLDTAFHPDDVLLALRRWGELGRTDFEEDFKEIEL